MSNSLWSTEQSLTVGLVAAKQAETYMSLADVDQTVDAEMTNNEGESSSTIERKLGKKEYVAFVTSAISFTTSILAMVLVQSSLIYVAMGVGIFNSMLVASQRFELAGMDSILAAINKIRQDVNELMTINKNLVKTIDTLENKAQRLSNIEAEVKRDLEERNTDMNQFMKLLHENKQTQKKILELLKAEVTQEIIEQVLKSDHDGDFKIDPEEIQMLIYRLTTLDGVHIDEERFKNQMDLHGSCLFSVINIVRSLVDNDGEDDPIIKLDVKELK